MTRRLAFAAVAAALLAAGCGGGGDEQPTLAELEKKFICPTCQTTLELSNAPVADRMRDFIRARLAAGDSEEEIEEALVAQFGEAVLASPPKEGFNLLAWVLPLAFAAGLVSFATPCVLPLVPGYLAVVSGQPVGQGGRRVLLASLPFVAGFTGVFVVLGAAVAAAGSLFGENRELLLAVAGLVVVILGFAMMGLLPFPFLDRLAAPGLVEEARGTGSAALLGGAFGLCAAPCIGPVLAGILALAGEGQTVAQGTLLLLVYSAGLALPFLLVGIGFDRALGAFRWLRDHYPVFRVVAGTMLVALGLLLFFDRFWWLNVAVNRVFELFGID